MSDGGTQRSQPLDRRTVGGDFVLQDFRQDVDPNLRYVLKACRIEKDDPVFGQKIVEGADPGDPAIGLQGTESNKSTVGDLHPFLWWPNSTREEGSWSPCFAAVVVSDDGPAGTHDQASGDATRTSWGTQRKPRGNPTGDAQITAGTRTRQQQQSQRTTLVLPVRTDGYDADVRYQPVEVQVPPGTPLLQVGTAGTVLRGTQEGVQLLLFLPLSNAPLISVNHAGNPDLSTLVYDLQATDELDPTRAAQLHTVWRVVPVDETGCSSKLTPFPIVAWQLGLSGQDSHAGCGLVTDAPGKALQQPAEEASKVQPTSGGTRTRDATTTGTTTGSDVGDGGSTPNAGKIEKLEARLRELAFERDALQAAGSSGFASGDFGARWGKLQAEENSIRAELARLREEDATRTSPDPDATRTDPRSVPLAGVGMVSACASSKVSGPLEVGVVNDPHQLGEDRDGNPINALHLATSTLFRGGVGDAPLDFEAVKYTRPDPMPLRSPVHLRIDPDSQHSWACGVAPGLWRFEAEVPFMGEANPRQPGGGGVQQRERTRTRTRTRGQTPGGGGGAGTAEDGSGSTADSVQGADADAVAAAGAVISEASEVGEDVASGAYAALADMLQLPAGALDDNGNLSVSTEEYLRLRERGVVDGEGVPVGAVPRVGDNDNTLRKKLGGVTERYPTSPQCMRFAGGLVFAAAATADGEVDLSRGGLVSREHYEVIRTAPDVACLVTTSVNETGTWKDGSRSSTVRSRPGTRGRSTGCVNFVGAGLTTQDVLDGNVSEVVPCFNLYESCLGFARPSTDGGVVDGYTIEKVTDLVITSYDANGNANGSCAIEQATGNLVTDALCMQAQQDGTGLPAGNEYFYVEDGTNLAAGTPAFRTSGGTVLELGGGLSGSTGSTDNAMLRADGTGGSAIQAGTNVTLEDDDTIREVAGLEMNHAAITTPFTNTGEYGLWLDNQFGTYLLTLTANGALDWVVPYVPLSGISDGDFVSWDDTSKRFGLTAASTIVSEIADLTDASTTGQTDGNPLARRDSNTQHEPNTKTVLPWDDDEGWQFNYIAGSASAMVDAFVIRKTFSGTTSNITTGFGSAISFELYSGSTPAYRETAKISTEWAKAGALRATILRIATLNDSGAFGDRLVIDSASGGRTSVCFTSGTYPMLFHNSGVVGTPPTNYTAIYADSVGDVYIKDDLGNTYKLGGAGGVQESLNNADNVTTGITGTDEIYVGTGSGDVEAQDRRTYTDATDGDEVKLVQRVEETVNVGSGTTTAATTGSLIPVGACVKFVLLRIITAPGTTNGLTSVSVARTSNAGTDADELGTFASIGLGTTLRSNEDRTVAALGCGYNTGGSADGITLTGDANFDGTGSFRVVVIYDIATAPTS